MTLTDLTTGELTGDLNDEPEITPTDENLAVAPGKPRPVPPKPKRRPTKFPRQPVVQPASPASIQADLRRLDEQRERGILAADPRLAPGSESGYDLRAVQPVRTDIKMEVKPSFDFRTSPFHLTSTERQAEIEPRAVRRRIGETQDEFLNRANQFEEAKIKLEERRQASRRLGRAENLSSSPTASRLAKSFATGVAEPFRQATRGIYLAAGGQAPDWATDLGMPLLNQADQGMFTSKLAGAAGSLIPALLYGTSTGGLGTSLFFGSGGLGSTYEEARAKGFDHQNALAAGTVGALIGSLEGVLGAGSTKQATGFLRNIIEESGEGVFTKLLSNVNARTISGYDPNLAISEGVLESGLIEGLLGGALPGGLKVADLASKVQADLGRPLSPAILDAARAFIKDEGGSASAINTAEGLNNLLSYLKESKVKTPEGDPLPIYHGTQSPREIKQVDFSKLDPGALYGPGFYMTQDPEVAAGEEGYAATKSPRIDVSQEDVDEFFTPGNIVPSYGGYDRVLEYRKGEDGNTFNVKVIAVDPENGEVLPYEKARWHSTRPDSQKIESVLGRRLPSPHAYKLYADIKNPFDMNVPVEPTPRLIKAISSWTGEDDYLVERKLATYQNGHDLYTDLSSPENGMDKSEINQMLKEAGYDGITHTGGIGRLLTTNLTLESAKSKALQVGGKVVAVGVKGQALNRLPDGTYRDFGSKEIHTTPPAYGVEGHRVWIAFDPKQVKSATGNIGTFNPDDPRISFVLNPISDPDSWRKTLSELSTFFRTRAGKNEPALKVLKRALDFGIKKSSVDFSKVENYISSNPDATPNQISDYLDSVEPQIRLQTEPQSISPLTFDPKRSGMVTRNLFIWEDPPRFTEFEYPLHFGRTKNVVFESTTEQMETTDGTKALLLTEAQSDWHQGRGPEGVAPFKNDWLNKALEHAISNAKDRGLDGILLLKTAEQVDHIQKWSGVEQVGGKFINIGGRDVTGIVRRYVEEIPKLARSYAKILGTALETRIIKDKLGEPTEVYFLPIPEKDRAESGVNFKINENKPDSTPTQASFQSGDNLKAGVIVAPAQHAKDLGLVRDNQSIGGASIDLSLTESQLKKTRGHLPTDLVTAMDAAITDAKTKGQSKVNFVFQGSHESPERIAQNIQHETFHAGQAQGVSATTMFDPEIFIEDLYAFHDPELRYDQRITDLLNSPMGQLVVADRPDEDLRRDSLVVELAAYIASGDGTRFGMNEQAQAEFLIDYFESAISYRGVEAIEALAATAQLRPTTERIINQVKENYAKQAAEAFQADRPVQGLRAALAAGTGSDGRNFSINETTGPEPGTNNSTDVQTPDPELTDLNTGQLGGSGGVIPPPLSLPPAPFDPGFDPVITQVLLNDPAMAEITEAFIRVVRDLGLQYDPRIPPFIQIARAITDGIVTSPLLDAVYARYGLTPEMFARGFQASASAFGRGLQHLSQIQRRLAGQIKLNPNLSKHLPPEQIANALLSRLHASSLGKSLWEQGGNLLRKMALGRLSTTAVNVITTLGRLPLSVADGLSGFAWGMLHPYQFYNSPTDSLLQAGRRSALNSMRSSVEVLRAMNPRQLVQLLKHQRPSEYAYYDSVVSQIEQYFPDLHRQLHGLSSQIDEAGTAPLVVETARQAVDRITDPAVRADYDRQISQLERRLKFDRTIAGKVVKSVDWIYTLPTLPSQWQEFFFRRPFFVGALHSELSREGINFDQVVSEGSWAGLDPTVAQRAVDRALEFTFAYAPHEDSTSSIERSSHHLIKGINSLGPIGFFIEAFPKALYNGLKFWYEYGPLGALHPANNIRRAISNNGAQSINYQDIDRMSRAALGTVMYVAAAALQSAAGGEEWWQVKTGKKDKAGKPIYLDIRRFQPFSAFVYLADLAKRSREGRLIDKQPSRDLKEIYLGARKAGDQSSGALFDTLDSTFAWWGDDFSVYEKSLTLSRRQIGQTLALPTVPLSNLRDLVAQFNADENIKRDTRSAWMGPAIDNIPWLRRDLPASQPPTEPSPQPLYATSPALGQFVGLRTSSGGNFITREIARLGLNPLNWLHRDPDPTIDRAQYAEFSRQIEARAERLSESDRYRAASDADKAALIEEMILDNDLPQVAKEKGLQANPSEALRREKLKEAGDGMHRLRRRASGVDKRFAKP